MEKICIHFGVRYTYRPAEDEPCIAYLQVSIPVGADQRIPSLLQSACDQICNHTLGEFWGDRAERNGRAYRACEIRISGVTWDELQESIDYACAEIKEILCRVAARNMIMIRTMPAPCESVFFVPTEDEEE